MCPISDPPSARGPVLPAQALFEPRSVAVVGVPRSPRPGQLFLRALLDPGYRGRIYPVNPNAQEILGLPCHPSVASLPEAVDLAIIVVPTAFAASVVRECAEKGVKAAIVFTAGFSELGTPEGRERGAELMAAARAGQLRLVGPNCMGVYVPKSGLGSFPGLPSEQGPIAFVSQSGSLSNRMVWSGEGRGLAFSKIISVGNQSDLETSDFLEYLAEDPETEIISAYIEGAKDGRRLWRALTVAGRRKHLVVLKVGRTRSGARAASSHTGALAGEAEVWAGMLRQAGALQVRDMDELLDTLVALRYLGRPTGKRMAILTGPGGPAVSAADACEETGLELADLAEQTKRRLRGVVVSAGTSVGNPVDIGLVLAGAAEMYRQALAATIDDPGVDAAVVIGSSLPGEGWQTHVEAMAELAQAAAKPILHVSFGPGDPDVAGALAAHGIPSFSSAERALQAYARVRRDPA
ncbi:MAG: CoA-binding protein [Deltaproteobacteria bacterium]|nr:CoA-binding protein [Deltaproteobacteria bacterium]